MKSLVKGDEKKEKSKAIIKIYKKAISKSYPCLGEERRGA